MSTIENAIINAVNEKLESGVIEKLVSERVEHCVDAIVKDMFGRWGDGKKVIEEKIKSVMIPQLEVFDYSEYITKLDAVLCEVLKNCTADNKKILENFKDLMTVDERKCIKVSELFEIWCKYVAKEVSTSGLKVEFDDSPCYEGVEVTCEFQEEDGPSWSSHGYGKLVLECEHDEDMNFEIRLTRWNFEESWSVLGGPVWDIRSLQRLNEMQVLLMRLAQSNVQVVIDDECISDFVAPDAVPEVHYS